MKKPQSITLAIFTITTLFIISRILAIKVAGSYWFDEAFSIHFAQMPLRELWGFLQFEHNPLVHFLLIKGWMMVFGLSELAARSLSMLAGLGSLMLFYQLGKRLFTQRVGVYASLLMILSPMFLYHQTEARMYSLVVIFSLITMLSFWEWMVTRKNWWLIAYTLSAILLVNTHITTWSLLIALSVCLLIEQRDEWKKWVPANLLVLAIFLLWFIPVFKNKVAIGNVENGWFFYQHARSFWIEHLTNFYLNGETGLWIRSIGALLLIILFSLAFLCFERPSWWQKIRSLLDHKRWPFTAVLLWDRQRRFLLLTFIIPLLIGFALQVTVTKYLLVAAIPFFLLVALGLASVKKAMARWVIISILILLVLPMQLRLLFEKRHHWDEAALQIELYQQEYPDAVIISHTFAWAFPLEFYGVEAEMIQPFYPLADDLSLDERLVRYNWQPIVNRDNVQSLQELILDHNAVILVSSTPERGVEDPVKGWFAGKGWKLIEARRFPGYGDPELLIYQK